MRTLWLWSLAAVALAGSAVVQPACAREMPLIVKLLPLAALVVTIAASMVLVSLSVAMSTDVKWTLSGLGVFTAAELEVLPFMSMPCGAVVIRCLGDMA